jgi:hypothetical protein
MDRKRTVLAALVIAGALVVLSGGLAFASGAFSTPPADRVGTFESISMESDATPPAPTTRTTRPTSPATGMIVVLPRAVEPEPGATTAPGVVPVATSAPTVATSSTSPANAHERESREHEQPDQEAAEPRDD